MLPFGKANPHSSSCARSGASGKVSAMDHPANGWKAMGDRRYCRLRSPAVRTAARKRNVGQITLITGGARSGKSAYALKIAQALRGLRVFVATCPVMDAELTARVAAHKMEREAAGWHTIEEEVELAGVLRDARDFHVILVDCLTLWVNNILFRALDEDRTITEQDMEERCRELIAACSQLTGAVIFVTNEVGIGIVPDNSVSRLYRDLLGRCNQNIAAAADRVVFMTCGLPLELKQGSAGH